MRELLRELGKDKAANLNSGGAAEDLRETEDSVNWKFDEGSG